MQLQRCTKTAYAVSLYFVRNLSNKTCIFTKARRSHYLRQYPTVIVQPDGSTYNIRYHEPRAIIKLPLNLSTLSEEERANVLENRRPKKKVRYQEEEKIDFNPSLYLKYLKKE